MTLEQYFVVDAQSERPNEYKNGITIPIEAATREHGLIVANLMYLIGAALRKKQSRCEVYSQCQRVYIPDEAVFADPDIVMVCEESKYGPENTLLDPVFIIEVLSPSTEDYDRGTKFKHYRSMPRFSNYFLVERDRIAIEHWKLDPASHKWMLYASLTSDSDFVEVTGDFVDSLPVSDIYRNVFRQ